ncbi:class III signal peptide-containing protein [Methanococcus voltae]|uniref:Uncharacterized protein n=1 Tax=Methanococcus voltae (strain ATCC BAA-1334 / A3) TaxID=456320 RepID=D7DUR3_METV3|nr:class III signal peptide-containing protein [Methanococcus voltae]MCS3900675.1 uncharacterized protein (UPF0333 family) [Methanococcus voltae]
MKIKLKNKSVKPEANPKKIFGRKVRNGKGQISMEFSILFLALLASVVVATIIPGLFGLDKTTEVAKASLAHGSLSNLKSNIQMMDTLDEGSYKLVRVKSPSESTWNFATNNITVSGDGFEVVATFDSDIQMLNGSSIYVNTSKLLSFKLLKEDNRIKIEVIP